MSEGTYPPKNQKKVDTPSPSATTSIVMHNHYLVMVVMRMVVMMVVFVNNHGWFMSDHNYIGT
jgi:hypothetical protein